MATNVDDVLAILAQEAGSGFAAYARARKEKEQEGYERAMRARLEESRRAQQQIENQRIQERLDMERAAERRAQATYEAGQPERQFQQWYYKPQVPQGLPWGVPVPSPAIGEYTMGQQAVGEKARLARLETEAQIREREAHEKLYGAQAAYYGRRPGTTGGAGAKAPSPQTQINTLTDDNRAINGRRQQLRKEYVEGLASPVDPDEVEAKQEYDQLGADFAYNLAEIARLRKEMGGAPEAKPTGNITDELIAEFTKYGDKASALAEYKRTQALMEARGADTKRIRKSIEKRFSR